MAGLFLSLTGTLLDYMVLNKRRKLINHPVFLKLQKHFSLKLSDHLFYGTYKNYPVTIGWNILPVPKTPKPGFFVFTVFSPVNSEKIFEIKKRMIKGNRILAENFYIYQFFQEDELINITPSRIENILNDNIKIIQKYSSPPPLNKCIGCGAKTDEEISVINDIPVPLCSSCKQKTGKKF